MFITRFTKVSVFLLFVFIDTSKGQNCRTRGEWCSDTELCCGGCCIQNVCTEMNYDDCSVIEEPCLDEYCPGDSVCRLYKPPCDGCDIERKCIYMDPSNNIQFNMNPNYGAIHSSSNLQKNMEIYNFLFCLIFVKYIL